MSIFQITALLGLVTFIPSSSKAARVEYTLVIHHQDVDTIDPVTNETYSRLGTFINETYPGPTLEANLGDEVVIKVINDMPTSSTAIHFHGQHQEGSFFSDGVPDITQCEIPAGPGSSFEYVFTAEPAGTFAYHSHNPYQTGDGIFGAFIVHDPENDPYLTSVKDEVVIGLSDWLRYYSDQVYQYVSQFRFDMWPLAHYISFVNGKGMPDPFVLQVESGETYRLRIYAMTVEYGYRLYLVDHKMTVIAADGSLVAPTEVDFLDVYSGERYDILLTADQAAGIYELRARVIDFTGVLQPEFTSAIIQYQNAGADASLKSAEAVMVDNIDTNTFTLLDPFSLTAFKKSDGSFLATYEPVEGPQEVLENPWMYKITSYGVLNERQYAFMDSWDFHFAMKSANTPLIFFRTNEDLVQLAEDESRTITVSSYSNNSATFEAKIGPRIQFLETDQLIDIVFQNAATPGNELGDFNAVHPMHLHGHYFWVLAQGDGAFDAEAANSVANFVDPPSRDNIIVHSNKWVLIRLKASNPGIWLFHCHSETHLVFGMSTTLVIGTAEERPTPPIDFPRCGKNLFCFSQNSVLKTPSGAVSMKDAKIGDMVLVSPGKYEPIYSFGHLHKDIVGTYLKFAPSGLEISPYHMIYRNGHAVPASMVKVGDVLSDGEVVTSIKSVTRRGAYAPFTPSGYLVVNGVKVSSFVAFQGSDVVKIGQVKTFISYQWLAHMFEFPHRLVCYYIGQCPSEKYSETGISTWVAAPYAAVVWFFNQEEVLIALGISLYTVAASVLYLLENLFWLVVPMAVAFLLARVFAFRVK